MVNVTISFDEELHDKAKQLEPNFSEYLRRLVNNDIRRRSMGEDEGGVQARINELEAELLLLYNKQKALANMKELEAYFTTLPDDKKAAILEHAQVINANYWELVRKQKEFDLMFGSGELYWKAESLGMNEAYFNWKQKKV